MKRMIKVMAAIVLVAAMVLSIASCGGVNMNKIKGDWTVSTVDGKAPLDCAKEYGAEMIVFAFLNYDITEKQLTEKTIDIAGQSVSDTFDIAVKSNGFELMKDGKVERSVAYDEKADSLSYKIKVNVSGEEKVVSVALKRGTTDLKSLLEDFLGSIANDEGAGEESGEESGEEYEEDYEEE